MRQAKNLLQIAGLQIEHLRYVEDIATNYILQEFVGTELVTETSEIMLEQGKGVILEVGVNAEENHTVVPLLAGKSLVDARNALWEAGLNCGELDYDGSITPTNKNLSRVFKQSMLQGMSTQLGTFVSLHLTVDDEKISNGIKENEEYMKSRLEEENTENVSVENAG